MPQDASGKQRPNFQAAAHADRMAAGHKKPGTFNESGGAGEGDGEHSQLHDHGDGTYHSVIGGEKTEHPHIGHALMHLAAHHEPDGIHHHAHHDGMGITSHHVEHGGEVQGPHEHESGEESGEHMASVMNGEGGGESHGEPDGDEMSGAGLSAMMG
jgi:hypothetical protein